MVRRKCGIAPKAYTVLPRSTGTIICRIKTMVFNTIKPIVTKGNMRVGLLSLKGIMFVKKCLNRSNRLNSLNSLNLYAVFTLTPACKRAAVVTPLPLTFLLPTFMLLHPHEGLPSLKKAFFIFNIPAIFKTSPAPFNRC